MQALDQRRKALRLSQRRERSRRRGLDVGVGVIERLDEQGPARLAADQPQVLRAPGAHKEVQTTYAA